MNPISVQTPTVEQSTQEIVAYMAKAIQASGDFVIEQAPDVLKQILIMDITRSILHASMLTIGMVVVIFATIFWQKWIVKNLEEGSDRRDISRPLSIVLAIVGIVLGSIFTVRSIDKALSAWLAPKAHLCERFGILKSL